MPAIFSVTVWGAVDPGLSDRLGGMTVTQIQCAEGVMVTILVGRLADQAVLFGVLNRLHNLALPLLAMQRLTSDI